MVKDLQPLMKEIDRLASSLNMDSREFGQRAMRASILSTSYQDTQNAVEKYKIRYRRALSLKLGIAVAEVFETMPEELEGELPFDDFINKTTTAYMRICGVPYVERYTRQNEIKGQVLIKLDRSRELGQIKQFTAGGEKFVKIMPSVSETAFAMLLDPESLLRTPHAKAMSQTIGAMAMVDKSPRKLTTYELASIVQDKLNQRGLLEAIKPGYAFSAKHIEPFHLRKNVSYYSDSDGKLFILPAFPETGISSIAADELPVIMNDDLVFEHIRDDALKDLTDGFNPVLVPVTVGDSKFYFNRASRYVEKLEQLLGANFSRFIPKEAIVIDTFNRLQSKISDSFEDGTKVANCIEAIVSDRLKDSDLGELDRRILSILYRNLGLVVKDRDGIYKPMDDRSRNILAKVKNLCNITDPIGETFSRMAMRVKE